MLTKAFQLYKSNHNKCTASDLIENFSKYLLCHDNLLFPILTYKTCNTDKFPCKYTDWALSVGIFP